MTGPLRLITIDGQETGLPSHDQLMAGAFIALGEQIAAGRISVEQGILVAVVDGGVSYTPFGHVTLAEGIGLLELASRKIERDMRS